MDPYDPCGCAGHFGLENESPRDLQISCFLPLFMGHCSRKAQDVSTDNNTPRHIQMFFMACQTIFEHHSEKSQKQEAQFSPALSEVLASALERRASQSESRKFSWLLNQQVFGVPLEVLNLKAQAEC